MFNLQNALLRWAAFLAPPALRESLAPAPGDWLFTPARRPSPHGLAHVQPPVPPCAPPPAQARPRGAGQATARSPGPSSVPEWAGGRLMEGTATGNALPSSGEALPPSPLVRIQVAAAEEEPAAQPPAGSGTDEEASPGPKKISEAKEEVGSEWRPPDPELLQKLVAQIEYYLSDDYLENDAFLLKHVRRNKMGYVSVKLLTSFKKVKHLTHDWQTTAFALKYSELLELNEEGRKVRRKTAVPVFPSEHLPSRMLLVYDMHLCPEFQVLNHNLEYENAGLQENIMEYVLKAFGVFGPVISVRVLKPGKELPADVKRLSNRYSQLGTKDCVIVEFEDVESAIKAHESLGKTDEKGMKVVLIGMKPPKKKVVREKNKEAEDVGKNEVKNKSANKRVEELQYTCEDSSACSSSEPESNPASPMLSRKPKLNNQLSPNTYKNNHLSPNTSPRASPWNSPRSSPSMQRKDTALQKSPLTADAKLCAAANTEVGNKWTDYSSDSSTTPSGSPWVQRRKQAQGISHENTPVGSPMLSRKMHSAGGLPAGVVRLPRGPDGTKGFQTLVERSKPLVI
ncbi:la-related protein 6a isoform X2 [Pristis pectinata]|uniref:la-related protein 6a isoform X2 n=1 Tax=Pristis pectinata TaxID=685728 RepID=UPI00223D9F04|nr:la-related protein 6a isoform X2 [Pristis pectinata]